MSTSKGPPRRLFSSLTKIIGPSHRLSAEKTIYYECIFQVINETLTNTYTDIGNKLNASKNDSCIMLIYAHLGIDPKHIKIHKMYNRKTFKLYNIYRLNRYSPSNRNSDHLQIIPDEIDE